MDFSFTPEQEELRAKIAAFAQEECAPGARARDESREAPFDIIRKLGEQGFTGQSFPVEIGGAGKGYTEYAICMEELSKVDCGVSVAHTVNCSLYGGTIMNSDATPELKEKFMTPVIKGEKIGCFALTEPTAGSDVAGALTMAVADGDDYVINGSKCFITNGYIADFFAVYAYTDKDLGPAKSMACFLVERDTEGLVIGERHNTSGLRSAQVCELFFNDMRVPAANMIAAPGKGFRLAMKTLDGGRIGVAAQALGIAEGAFEIARKYMMERQQFGKQLFKFQHLAFKMAELQTEIENAKDLVYKAAWKKDTGDKTYGLSASRAKYFASDCASHVCTEAIQFMGGNGYMKEYDVERMWRDAKITQIYEGTNEIQKLIISGSIFR